MLIGLLVIKGMAAVSAINPALIWDAQDAYMYALLAPTLLVSLMRFCA
jgi:uncharacterized membrane protein